MKDLFGIASEHFTWPLRIHAGAFDENVECDADSHGGGAGGGDLEEEVGPVGSRLMECGGVFSEEVDNGIVKEVYGVAHAAPDVDERQVCDAVCDASFEGGEEDEEDG